jgi:FkbM family methyltransferase
MNNLIPGIFKKIGQLFLGLSKLLSRSEKSLTLAEWHKTQGDRFLRLNYDLSAESVVFDLGGYIGQWTSDIFSKYQPVVYVFEPLSTFFDSICERFKHNPKIKVFQFGLGAGNQTVELSIGADGSSMHRKTGSQSEKIMIRSARDFFSEQAIGHVDLMKINIEGAEYDLLEVLIDSGLIQTIENIQVQFHDFVPNAEQRMRSIQERLAKTHKLTWQYRFVWENWQKLGA